MKKVKKREKCKSQVNTSHNHYLKKHKGFDKSSDSLLQLYFKNKDQWGTLFIERRINAKSFIASRNLHINAFQIDFKQRH